MKVVEALMDDARAAIKKSKYDEAIQLLKKVLNYPENKHSAEAQELAGRGAAESRQDRRSARRVRGLFAPLRQAVREPIV